MPPRTVAEHVADPQHAGPVDGAPLAGEAAGANRLLVRLGIWLDAAGCVSKARYRATTCASLIAYAEAACALAEAGEELSGIHARRLRGAVPGVHPVHHDRADLVALALSRAFRGASGRRSLRAARRSLGEVETEPDPQGPRARNGERP